MRVLIAGGGTGGHLFPGIALAEEIVTRHPKNDVVFVGTDRGLEARVVPQNGFVFEAIKSRGFQGPVLAKAAVSVIIKMIFEDGFFHADPHPGNIRILGEPDKPVIGLIDLGMVGRLSPRCAIAPSISWSPPSARITSPSPTRSTPSSSSPRWWSSPTSPATS